MATGIGVILSSANTSPRSMAVCVAAATLAFSAALRAQTDSSGCASSGPPKAALAWESGRAEGVGRAEPVSRDEIVVRVVSVRSGQPIPNARVLWNPGGRWVLTDSSGIAHIRSSRQGRYQLRVAALGFGEVADSLTLGFDGLRVVAALTTYRGDILCTPQSRRPSNER